MKSANPVGETKIERILKSESSKITIDCLYVVVYVFVYVCVVYKLNNTRVCKYIEIR